jgi:chromosome partitioning protein
LSERVIYKELFLNGLTLLDLRRGGSGPSLTLSHVTARQEVRDLVAALNLPPPVFRAPSAGPETETATPGPRSEG